MSVKPVKYGIVSIIIPAHNAAKTLESCLAACLQQTYPEIEVIVVDDGSTDATARIAQSFPVRFIQQEQRGPAAARNAGARIAGGGILVYTDADCVPRPDWIGQLLTGFEEGIVAVGGTYGIANPGALLARLVHEEIMVRHEPLGDSVDFLGSFNVAYEKGAFDRIGGFDEDFTAASGEDNDLAYRLVDAGGRLRFVREAVVRHYHPTRISAYLRSQMRHGYWRMKLYSKHPRHSGGDRYAGISDLAAPALVCLVVATVAMGLTAGFNAIAAIVSAALCVLLIATRIQVPWRMFQRTGDFRMALFVPIMLVRDVARAIGMIHGLWTFLVLRRKTV
jgi:glycosyltransferase involved in cell wall biosynthesis